MFRVWFSFSKLQRDGQHHQGCPRSWTVNGWLGCTLLVIDTWQSLLDSKRMFYLFSFSLRDRKFNTCSTCLLSKTRFIASIFPPLSWIKYEKWNIVSVGNYPFSCITGEGRDQLFCVIRGVQLFCIQSKTNQEG